MRIATKRALVVALVAASAFAPTGASANQWTLGGVPYSGPAQLQGTLTTTLTASGVQTTCDVTGVEHLANTGVAPLGQANGQILSGTASSCTTTLPGCTLSASYSGMPWSITTSGAAVTVSGISYNATYSGAGCALSGVTVVASGSVTGSYVPASSVIAYSSASGIGTSLGPLALSGWVSTTNNNPFDTRPIELTP